MRIVRIVRRCRLLTRDPHPPPEGSRRDFEPARSRTRTVQTSPRVMGGSFDAVIDVIRLRSQRVRLSPPGFSSIWIPRRVNENHARGGHERRVGTSTRVNPRFRLYATVLCVFRK